MKSNTIIAILAVVLAGMTIAAGVLLFQQNRTQNALEASRQTSENRFRELQQQQAEMETRLAEAREKTGQIESQVKQISELRSLVEAKDREMGQIAAKSQAITEKMQEKITTLESRNNRLNAQKERLENQITALNEEISGLKSRQADLTQTQAELKKTQTELNQIQADFQAASETVTQLRDERDAAVKEIDRLKNKAAEQDEKLAAAETALAEKTVQMKTLNVTLAKAKEKTLQLQSMQASREQQISGLKKEKAALEKAAALAQVNAAAQEKKVMVLIDQIDELKSLLETRDREMGQIAPRSHAITEKMQEKITTLEYRNNRLNAQKERLENQITALNEQISGLKSRQVDLKQTKADLQAANKKVAQLRDERHAAVTEIDWLKKIVTEQTGKMAAAEIAVAEKEDQVELLNAALVDANEKIQIYQDRLETIYGTKSRIEEEFQKFKQTHTSLVTDLEQQITDKEITVDRLQERITITFIDQILFSSGRTALNRKGKEALDKVGRILQKEAQDREIMVVGHTDNLPIHKDFRDKYTTNWELSAHRAASVVRYLQYKSGLDPGNLRAVGRSFYEPVAENDTPEGRAQNRRVEIIIAPNYNMAETR